MKRWIYVLGTAAAFALLGAWAGEQAGANAAWYALSGAAIGYLLGVAFAPRAKSAS